LIIFKKKKKSAFSYVDPFVVDHFQQTN